MCVKRFIGSCWLLCLSLATAACQQASPPPMETLTPIANEIPAAAEATRQHRAALLATNRAINATIAYVSTVEAQTTYTATATAGPATQAAYAATHVTGDGNLDG